jgi:hypothetical protein
METSTFSKIWYTLLAIFVIAGCSMFLGTRDTNYLGEKDARVPIEAQMYGDWWKSTVILRTYSGKQWCSGVAVNNVETLIRDGQGISITWVVTAKHCTDRMVKGTVSYVEHNPDGTLRKEVKFRVLKIFNHPEKDFAVLMVEGIIPFTTPVYCATPPAERQDFIIGYRGDGHGGKWKFGKHISPAWAYKGQSGGGVFTPGLGLHAIVSTHVDGVNIYVALKEMKIEHILDRGATIEEFIQNTFFDEK